MNSYAFVIHLLELNSASITEACDFSRTQQSWSVATTPLPSPELLDETRSSATQYLQTES
jgi:hypothetical protein